MRLCYVAVMQGNAYGLGIAQEGERGYYFTNYPSVPTMREAEDWANALNARMKMTENEVRDIILSTMRRGC